MDHDTDITDHKMQDTFVNAFSKLNKQRIHLYKMATEGQRRETLDPAHNLHEAQEAVDALQKVIRFVFKAIKRLC
jgi:hypothetical protein